MGVICSNPIQVDEIKEVDCPICSYKETPVEIVVNPVYFGIKGLMQLKKSREIMENREIIENK